MSARDSVETAERYAHALLEQERMTRTTPYAADIIDGYVEAALANSPVMISDELVAKVRRQGRHMWAEVSFCAQDQAVRRLWQQGRIVYDIDRDLWAELGDTDFDTRVPRGLFAKLPHANPFIALPEPLVLQLDARTQQRVHGFFVRGGADIPDVPGGQIQCSTHAPNATHLGLLLGGMVERLDGMPIMITDRLQDMVWTRISLDPRVGEGTVADMIARSAQRFVSRAMTGDWRTQVPVMVSRAVSLLVYLCATNADLAPLPRSVVSGPVKKTGKRKPKPPQAVAVGYRIGAALRAHRAGSTVADPGSPTGRTVSPHVRRAHFHTYRVGPGRVDTEVKWLPPIPINVQAEAAKATVVRVPKTRGA